MKLFNIITLLAVSITGQVFAQQSKVMVRLDSLLEYYNQTFDYNGVAFVSLKGETLIKKSYGYQDRYKKIRNNADNIFMIGSITKQFTAELILILAKENKLSLQDKMSKYFPEIQAGDKITIEHLLTHTSGLFNYTEADLWKNHSNEHISQAQMIEVFKDKPLHFDPGSKFEYCNSGYILLSYIIEKVTGKPYTVFARERILSPLRMSHSGFDYAHFQNKNKVTGYKGVIVDSFYVASIEDSTQSLGAGALFSSIDDLYKWHRALQSYTLLDKAWQQRAYDIYKGNYGYGWFISENLYGKKILAHSGGISGFYTYLSRVENEDLCIVLLTNIRASGIDLNEVSKNVIKCLYDPNFKIPKIRKEIVLNLQTLKEYEGTYVLTADTNILVSFSVKGKYLFTKISGQPEDRLYPESANYFFVKSADAQFEFVKEPGCERKLFVHQHGEKFEATYRQ